MKKISVSLLLITLTLTTAGLAQTGNRKTSSNTRSKAVYYISIARSNAAQFSKNRWQQAANTIRRGGIPAFFANHESLPPSSQVRGDWLLVRIIRRLSAPAADALMLGPFSSKQAASAAVNKLPHLLSDEGQPLNENYPGDWSMGNYIIMGVRTK